MYSHARSQILMMNPLPSVSKAYAMITSDESQRITAGSRISGDVHESMVMYAGKGNQYVGRMPTDLMMYSGNGKAIMHPGNGQGNFNYSGSTDSMALYTGRGG